MSRPVNAATPAKAAEELKAVTAEVAALEKRLDALLKGSSKPRVRNFRYSVDFSFPLVPLEVLRADFAPYVQARNSFVVKKGTLFDVLAVEAAYTAVGTLATTGETAQLTLPYWVRRFVFDFYWGVYDSGSDRAWQNALLPSWALSSENRNGVWFSGPDSDGRGLLSGGSEVTVTLAPFKNSTDQFTTGLSSLTSHNVQLSFIGVEVVL